MTKTETIPISDGVTTYEIVADVLKGVIRDAILEALLAKEYADVRMAETFRRREKEGIDYPAFDYAGALAEEIEWARKMLKIAAGQD